MLELISYVIKLVFITNKSGRSDHAELILHMSDMSCRPTYTMQNGVAIVYTATNSFYLRHLCPNLWNLTSDMHRWLTFPKLVLKHYISHLSLCSLIVLTNCNVRMRCLWHFGHCNR